MIESKIKKQLRTNRRRYLQVHIANKLGISESYLSQLLSGKRKSPEILLKLKEVLDAAN